LSRFRCKQIFVWKVVTGPFFCRGVMHYFLFPLGWKLFCCRCLEDIFPPRVYSDPVPAFFLISRFPFWGPSRVSTVEGLYCQFTPAIAPPPASFFLFGFRSGADVLILYFGAPLVPRQGEPNFFLFDVGAFFAVVGTRDCPVRVRI